MSEKDISWLKSKEGFLNINKIERELSMTQGTLRKFVNGERTLTDQWEKKVSEWVKKFKK